MSPLLTNKPSDKTCPRCQRSFACQMSQIDQCQCRAVTLTATQRYRIGIAYEDCLCADCLLALQQEIGPDQLAS